MLQLPSLMNNHLETLSSRRGGHAVELPVHTLITKQMEHGVDKKVLDNLKHALSTMIPCEQRSTAGGSPTRCFREYGGSYKDERRSHNDLHIMKNGPKFADETKPSSRNVNAE